MGKRLTKNDGEQKVNHPAKFTDSLIPVFASMLDGTETILDPFAGTGKIYNLLSYHPNLKIYANEIEREWAPKRDGSVVGDALNLSFGDSSFNCCITSPTYGNGMASTYTDGTKRFTYTAFLGRKLNAKSSGSIAWGKRYKEFHISAWKEVYRILEENGKFILNVKNHIRNGVEQKVTEWHVHVLAEMGFKIMKWRNVAVPSVGYGQHRNARVPYESIILFRKDVSNAPL